MAKYEVKNDVYLVVNPVKIKNSPNIMDYEVLICKKDSFKVLGMVSDMANSLQDKLTYDSNYVVKYSNRNTSNKETYGADFVYDIDEDKLVLLNKETKEIFDAMFVNGRNESFLVVLSILLKKPLLGGEKEVIDFKNYLLNNQCAGYESFTDNIIIDYILSLYPNLCLLFFYDFADSKFDDSKEFLDHLEIATGPLYFPSIKMKIKDLEYQKDNNLLVRKKVFKKN